MSRSLHYRRIDRPIIGFHLDERGDRVAGLACGHFRHLRHDPPWTNRPWTQNLCTNPTCPGGTSNRARSRRKAKP